MSWFKLSPHSKAVLRACSIMLLAVAISACEPDLSNDRPAPGVEGDGSVAVDGVAAPQSIWLKDLEQAARHGSTAGVEADGAVAFGGLTNITGYRWSKTRQDFEIMGERGDPAVPPILLDQFVEALRMGHEDVVWISMVPEDPQGQYSPYLAVGNPKEVVGSRFSEPLLQAYYFIRLLSLGFVPSDVEGLDSRRKKKGNGGQDNLTEIFGQQGVSDLYSRLDEDNIRIKYGETRDGFEMIFEKIPVVVTAGSKNVPEVVAEFAKDFTRDFELVERQYPRVFKPMTNMFKLCLLGDMLLKERDFVPVDLDYWLSEYPLEPYQGQTRFPGFMPPPQ